MSADPPTPPAGSDRTTGQLVIKVLAHGLPQPGIAIALTAGTAAAFLLALLCGPASWDSKMAAPLVLLTACLVVVLVLSFKYPIHLQHGAKIYMSSVLLYLIATLLSPPLAIAAAILGVLAGELSIRTARGAYPTDVATQTARLALGAVFGSLAAHLIPNVFHAPLLAAGLTMWLWDVATAPLLLYPVHEESPARIISRVLSASWSIELSQYLLGILGALLARHDLWALCLLLLPAATVQVAFRRAREVHVGTEHLLECLADTVDLRDPTMDGHSRRVAELAALILKQMGKQGSEVRVILWAARLHDVGKIGLPDSILSRSDSLPFDKWAVMATHPEVGANLLSRYPEFEHGVEMVRHHHERWDGEGYPSGSRETEIPFGARVIAVADSYDAMMSEQPNRGGMSSAQALAVLRDGRGRQWDPEVVDAFVKAVEEQPEKPCVPYLRLVTDAPERRGSIPLM